jgi:hypothetical protein
MSTLSLVCEEIHHSPMDNAFFGLHAEDIVTQRHCPHNIIALVFYFDF